MKIVGLACHQFIFGAMPVQSKFTNGFLIYGYYSNISLRSGTDFTHSPFRIFLWKIFPNFINSAASGQRSYTNMQHSSLQQLVTTEENERDIKKRTVTPPPCKYRQNCYLQLLRVVNLRILVLKIQGYYSHVSFPFFLVFISISFIFHIPARRL